MTPDYARTAELLAVARAINATRRLAGQILDARSTLLKDAAMLEVLKAAIDKMKAEGGALVQHVKQRDGVLVELAKDVTDLAALFESARTGSSKAIDDAEKTAGDALGHLGLGDGHAGSPDHPADAPLATG